MATTTIKNYMSKDITTAKPTTITSHTSAANNNLLLTRIGNVVMLSGSITNTYQCAQYADFFGIPRIPQGFRPIANVSLVPLNAAGEVWLFISTGNNVASPQNAPLAAGTRYFSATWLTNE